MTLCSDDIEVLFQDDVLLVLNKPSGLIVHRGWARDRVTMMDLARSIAGCKVYPVHRLDRGTSGVLVFALNPEVARTINDQLARRELSKRYIALVIGTPDAKMMLDMTLSRKKEGLRVPSCTLLRRLYAMEYDSVVEAVPLTGRLHQIRRHLHHVAHAVIGDKKYGYRWKNNFHRDKYGLERLALHAWTLSMPHPVTQAPLCFVAPLPSDLLEPFEQMGIPQRVWDDLYAAPTDPWPQSFPAWDPTSQAAPPPSPDPDGEGKEHE